MTNAERFKTARERRKAYQMFVRQNKENVEEFFWLDLEYKETLKKCPFCGGTAILHTAVLPYIRCDNCSIQTITYNTPEEAVAAWNRRAR